MRGVKQLSTRDHLISESGQGGRPNTTNSQEVLRGTERAVPESAFQNPLRQGGPDSWKGLQLFRVSVVQVNTGYGLVKGIGWAGRLVDAGPFSICPHLPASEPTPGGGQWHSARQVEVGPYLRQSRRTDTPHPQEIFGSGEPPSLLSVCHQGSRRRRSDAWKPVQLVLAASVRIESLIRSQRSRPPGQVVTCIQALLQQMGEVRVTLGKNDFLDPYMVNANPQDGQGDEKDPSL